MVVLSKDLQDDTGGKWERRFVRKMVFVLHRVKEKIVSKVKRDLERDCIWGSKKGGAAS